MPVPPAHADENHGGGSENPSGGQREATNLLRAITREEFLTESHFDTHRRAGVRGNVTKSLQLELSFAPGFLQSGTTSAGVGVVDRGGAFDSVQAIRGLAIEIKADRFELFAVHVATSLLTSGLLISSYHSQLPSKKFPRTNRFSAPH